MKAIYFLPLLIFVALFARDIYENVFGRMLVGIGFVLWGGYAVWAGGGWQVWVLMIFGVGAFIHGLHELLVPRPKRPRRSGRRRKRAYDHTEDDAWEENRLLSCLHRR